MAIKELEDLKVYKLSFDLAMKVFWKTAEFPNEERYSLTDQIRRSSRSITVNIAEGWGKRDYEQMFKRHLVDAKGSLEETKSWLKFANECKYIDDDTYKELFQEIDHIGAMIYKLHIQWK